MFKPKLLARDVLMVFNLKATKLGDVIANHYNQKLEALTDYSIPIKALQCIRTT